MSSDTTLQSADRPDESPYARSADRDQALALGVWVFLASETLLFAGLLALYAGYRAHYPEAFARCVAENNQWSGSANTFILLISSFFVAWAVHAMRFAQVRKCLYSLLGAAALGVAFLVLKGLEYADHGSTGRLPGPYYHAPLGQEGAPLFFTLYFLATGLHALHVVAGLAVLLWLVRRVRRGLTTPAHHVELELGGLYWHLVDIVWIFLWPLFYLIR